MPRRSTDDSRPVPKPPPPSSTNAADGVDDARDFARKYLVDLTRLQVAIALSPDSEAAAHTRMLAANAAIGIAFGTLPQPVPTLPPLPGNGRG